MRAQEQDPALVRSRISYYVKKGYVLRLRRGLYAKEKNYDKFQVAARLLTPSYITFETVLLAQGLIFQYYERIFSASYQRKTIVCDQHTYEYRKLKNTILTNADGIELYDDYSIATCERAFLDTLYLYPDYFFDSLDILN